EWEKCDLTVVSSGSRVSICVARKAFVAKLSCWPPTECSSSSLAFSTAIAMGAGYPLPQHCLRMRLVRDHSPLEDAPLLSMTTLLLVIVSLQRLMPSTHRHMCPNGTLSHQKLAHNFGNETCTNRKSF